MEKCWICSRTYKDVIKELGFKLDKKSIMLKPDFMEISKEVQAYKGPSAGLNKEFIDKHFGKIRICSICSQVVWCGVHRRFEK